MAILKSLEFFVTPDGFVYYKKPGEESRRLTKFNTDIVDELHNVIKTRFPEGYAALAKLYRRTLHDTALAGSPYSIQECQRLLAAALSAVT